MILDECYAGFVNLDHRKDRLAHMTLQLDKAGIQASRHRGIMPNEITDPRTEVMRRRTPGAIGCHFAQVGVIQTAKELGKHALVMEDDIVFCEDFHKRMEIISEWMSVNEWDVFYLGSACHIGDSLAPHWHPKGPSKMKPDVSAYLGYDAKRTDHERIMQVFGAFDTFAYIVNYNSIDKVLKMLDDFLPETIGIDFSMIYWQPRGMNSFCFLPGLVRQMTNMSDIGTGITNWDNFLKLGGFVFQERMEQFDPSTYNFGACEK